MAKIDIIYAWCGMENDDWKQIDKASIMNDNYKRQRYNYELEYSLKSVKKYLSWANHIYILINSDTKIPRWFIPDKNISFINRCELFDNKSYCPTRNSYAVYAICHKIPNLCNKFIYLDDDMFFCGPVEPEYFFDGDYPIVREKYEPVKVYSSKSAPNSIIYPKYKWAWVSHRPMPMTRQLIQLFETYYPDYLSFVQSHIERYCGPSEEIFMIYYYFLYE